MGQVDGIRLTVREWKHTFVIGRKEVVPFAKLFHAGYDTRPAIDVCHVFFLLAVPLVAVVSSLIHCDQVYRSTMLKENA